MTRKIPRKPLVGDPITVGARLRQFLALKVQTDLLSERMDVLKKDLQDAVTAQGYEDDKGNFWLDLDEPVTVDGYGTVPKLKRERRVTLRADEEAAEALLKAKGLYEDCTTSIVVLDEEEIRKAHYKGLLSDEDIDIIFPAKVTYAFKPERAK